MANFSKAFSRIYQLRLQLLPLRIREYGIIYCLRMAVCIVFTQPERVILITASLVLTPLAIILAVTRIRFVHGDHALGWMGHLAVEADLYLKSGLLGWGPKHHLIWLTPAGKAVNPALLRYWGRYIKLISNPLLIKLLSPLEAHPLLGLNISFSTLSNGQKQESTPAKYAIQEMYETRLGGEPLLTLSSEHHYNGWLQLSQLGIPEGSWFVCLHVREGGYHSDLPYHAYRDADVDTYQLAIDEVIRRGGWVVRMGDPSTTPLDDMEKVIDYAHCDFRSDWMDLFFFSQCSFLLGTTSGVSAVARAFGVPGALTNYVAMGHGACSRQDIWIPKMYWSQAEDRHLTFQEVLLSPSRHYGRSEDFENQRISLIDNTPEEIRDLAVEMMDRLEGEFTRSSQDHILQTSFKSLLGADPMYATAAHVGRDFLRKYSWLLPEEELLFAPQPAKIQS